MLLGRASLSPTTRLKNPGTGFASPEALLLFFFPWAVLDASGEDFTWAAGILLFLLTPSKTNSSK